MEQVAARDEGRLSYQLGLAAGVNFPSRVQTLQVWVMLSQCSGAAAAPALAMGTSRSACTRMATAGDSGQVQNYSPQSPTRLKTACCVEADCMLASNFVIFAELPPPVVLALFEGKE